MQTDEILKSTHRVDLFVLSEAHGGYSIDGHSQSSDEQMDKCDPVGKKWPGEDRGTILCSLCFGNGKNP